VERPIPQLNWTFTSRLISAGLRTDVRTVDDADIKELVEQAIPKKEILRVEGRKVLEALDIVYVEPSVVEMLNAVIGEGSEFEEEDFEYGSVSDEIDDHSDYSDLESEGYDGFDFYPPFMGPMDGEEEEGEEEEENEQGEQGEQGEDGWDEDHSSEFDDYDENGQMPIPVPLLFGLLM
jgi:hypothetical protein